MFRVEVRNNIFFWTYFNSGCDPDSHLWTSANHVAAAFHVWVTWVLFLLFLYVRRWNPPVFWNLTYKVLIAAGENEEVGPLSPFAGFIPLTGRAHSSGLVWHEEQITPVLIPRIWKGGVAENTVTVSRIRCWCHFPQLTLRTCALFCSLQSKN